GAAPRVLGEATLRGYLPPRGDDPPRRRGCRDLPHRQRGDRVPLPLRRGARMIRVAVKFREGASDSEIDALERRHGLEAMSRIPALRLRGYELPRDKVGALEGE